MKQTLTKTQITNQIKLNVIDVILNIDGIVGIYGKSKKTNKQILLPLKDQDKGVEVDWKTTNSFDISLKVQAQNDISIKITYNIIKNMLISSFSKFPKYSMSEFYLNIEEIK